MCTHTHQRIPAEFYSWVYTYVVASEAQQSGGSPDAYDEGYGVFEPDPGAGSDAWWERAWDEDLEDH